MTHSIWGSEPKYIPHEEYDMTTINSGLEVVVEMAITHADGTTDTEIVTLRPEPIPDEEIVEGE
jgi:hypothetical protein